MLKTVEEIRKAIEMITSSTATVKQTECYTEIKSGRMNFTLQRVNDFHTKETLGWFVSSAGTSARKDECI